MALDNGQPLTGDETSGREKETCRKDESREGEGRGESEGRERESKQNSTREWPPLGRTDMSRPKEQRLRAGVHINQGHNVGHLQWRSGPLAARANDDPRTNRRRTPLSMGRIENTIRHGTGEREREHRALCLCLWMTANAIMGIIIVSDRQRVLKWNQGRSPLP